MAATRVHGSGRMGLVIGARWLALGTEQGHITDAAEQFASALFDPALGACEPAIGGVRVIRDPARDELDSALARAFANAAKEGATLAISLVGHGYRTTSKGPYYFVPSDHPMDLDDAGPTTACLVSRPPAGRVCAASASRAASPLQRGWRGHAPLCSMTWRSYLACSPPGHGGLPYRTTYQ